MSISFKTGGPEAVQDPGQERNLITVSDKTNRCASQPRGPSSSGPGWPLLQALRADSSGFISRLHRDHGDITFMRLFNERASDLFTPKPVREALVDHADSVICWERGIEVSAQLFG